MSTRFSPYILWAILALPAVAATFGYVTSDDARAIGGLIHFSGEMSARLLIVVLMATPLAMLLKGWRGPRWLVKNRRALGVAAAGYALLHAVAYLIKSPSMAATLADLPKLYIWTGWAALAIFIPLAATSSDAAVRWLGRRWKPLQRWTYAAAVLTLLHWAAIHDWGGWMPAAIHFTPLALLEAYRLFRPHPRRATAT